MEKQIEIFKSKDNQIELNVQFDEDTVWLTQEQMELLFQTTKQNVSLHIKNIFEEGELTDVSTVKESLTVRTEGNRKVQRKIQFYNLDVIISVGYRVKSQRGTQFRQWATQRLKDYLVQGYTINEKRLAQKQQEVEYLKTGIRILNRAFEQQATEEDSQMLRVFARGLALLDDYDHQTLETKGKTVKETVFPTFDEYMELIHTMYSDFASDVFAQPKDESFHSSINQIAQSFGGVDLYQSFPAPNCSIILLSGDDS